MCEVIVWKYAMVYVLHWICEPGEETTYGSVKDPCRRSLSLLQKPCGQICFRCRHDSQPLEMTASRRTFPQYVTSESPSQSTRSAEIPIPSNQVFTAVARVCAGVAIAEIHRVFFAVRWNSISVLAVWRLQLLVWGIYGLRMRL